MQGLDTDNPGDYVSAIKAGGKMVPEMSIEIPLEVALANLDGGRVRVVSFLHNNVESLFPRGLPGEETE